jgi:hypothetical protein
MPSPASASAAAEVSLRAPGDQRHVTAFAQDKRNIERQRFAVVFHNSFRRPVDAGRLQKHHRIRIADGGEQEPIGALRRGRRHHPQARNVGEHRFRALGVMLGRANAGAGGHAQHHRAGEPPLGAVAQPGCVVGQLIDAGVGKAHELNFADGPQALRRHADAQPADQQLGKRRIDDALRSEAPLQSDGGTKDAAVDTDVFPEHDYVWIFLQGARQRQVDGFDQGDLSHCPNLHGSSLYPSSL